MVQGTASAAGKSTLVAGLCRMFARRGVRVAPFKAQNMSNNAAVCADGGEIGRAQFAQALAASIEATTDMNPVLLKPHANGAQVIVRGRVDTTGAELWPIVTDALDRLRSHFDLVIAEGAGSPAEINLRAGDIANMAVALYASADVLLVADIDRGGAFAAVLGTWEWLSPDERQLVRGFVLNKFRGRAELLEPAPTLLQQRTGVPVVGVVPFIHDLALPEEDAATLDELQRTQNAPVEIAIVRLPHLSNIDEFGPLMREPRVQVRWISHPVELRAPDLVILPGSKATVPDLVWLHERGLAERIRWLALHRTAVLGICGGYQMLGRSVSDPQALESPVAGAPGLALLPVSTELRGHKRLRRVQGHACVGLPGPWGALSGAPVDGYEIHVGATEYLSSTVRPFLQLEDATDGAISADGVVAGSYVHGVLERDDLRHTLLGALAAARGFTWTPERLTEADPYDRLADILEQTLRLEPALASATLSCRSV